jgi:hypothetical protein
MSDIVERLRVHARTGDGWTRADCAEAAAEIERLRLEANGLLDGNLAIWAAHNRLREALREIARMETSRANATVGRMAAKAQAALGDGWVA